MEGRVGDRVLSRGAAKLAPLAPRLVIGTLAGAAALAAALFAFHSVEEVLIRNPRFALSGRSHSQLV